MPRPRGRPRASTTTRRRPREQKSVFKKAEVGRFDGTYSSVAFRDGDEVGDLLAKASITLNSGDEINDDKGRAVSRHDLAKDKETYHVVSNYKNGQ